MAKKKIVETEPVVINKTDIISEEEISKEETIEVEAPEVIIEDNSKYSVKVQIAFSDKYTDAKYKVGDLLENLSKERYEELINDPRKLVSNAY